MALESDMEGTRALGGRDSVAVTHSIGRSLVRFLSVGDVVLLVPLTCVSINRLNCNLNICVPIF